jgi:hypothetical protein
MARSYYLDQRTNRAGLWSDLGLFEFLSDWADGTDATLLLLHTTDVVDQLQEHDTPEQFEARMRGANTRLAILYISGGLDAWAPLAAYGPRPANPRSYAHTNPVEAGDFAFQHRVRLLLSDLERAADAPPDWEVLSRSWIREATVALMNRLRRGTVAVDDDPFDARYGAEIEHLGLTADEKAALDAARTSLEPEQLRRALTVLERLLQAEASR